MRDETLALFASYIKKVIANARIDYIRKMNTIRSHEVMMGKAYEEEAARLEADEELPLEQIISESFIESLLDSLSESESYVLYHVVCMGEPAILSAGALGIAEKSVSRIKRRALTKLRNNLKEASIDDGL